MLEFGTFLRAVNDRPYEWMTICCLEFDGDSHTRKANWFGMTVLFDVPTSSANSNFPFSASAPGEPVHNLFTDFMKIGLAFLGLLRYDMLALRKQEC